MEHEITFGNSNGENGPTFLDFPLFLGIFQWDEPTKRVLFTAEPEIPEMLTKWKAPLELVSAIFQSFLLTIYKTEASPRLTLLLVPTLSNRELTVNKTSEGTRQLFSLGQGLGIGQKKKLFTIVHHIESLFQEFTETGIRYRLYDNTI